MVIILKLSLFKNHPNLNVIIFNKSFKYNSSNDKTLKRFDIRDMKPTNLL